MILQQIFNMIDVGLVILDRDFKVCYWNRWLASHSGISAKEIKGASLFDFYPHLKKKKFLRNFKAVITFGNCYFFPQKLYEFIFPFKPESNFISEIDYMQQSCIMGPLRNKQKAIEYVYISIKDVTEVHIYEQNLTSALFSLLEKHVVKDSIKHTEVQSVLSELLSTSSEEFLVRQAAPPKEKDKEKDIPEILEHEMLEILSDVRMSNG